VRTLDALHLGTLLLLQPVAADLSVVSLDERIRTNSALLGVRVLPPA
jgi:hypothetical protein